MDELSADFLCALLKFCRVIVGLILSFFIKGCSKMELCTYTISAYAFGACMAWEYHYADDDKIAYDISYGTNIIDKQRLLCISMP